MTDPSTDPRGDAGADAPPHRRPLPVGPAVVALVLLALPIVALLVVPLYARDQPELLGFPFFYWFQLAMVVVASALTYAAYVVVHRARRDRSSRGDRR